MPLDIAKRYLPIRTAYTGICCVNCMKRPAKLVKCSGCKRATYCDQTCQRADWKNAHKAECQLLKTFQEQYKTFPGSDLRTKVGFFKMITDAKIEEGSLPVKVKNMWPRHHNFLAHSRVCSHCLTNDYDECSSDNDWKHCPTCNFGWCCSEDHWEQYKEKHTPAICQSYVCSMAIEQFLWTHAKTYDDTFLNLPESPLTETLKQFPANWTEYFKLRFGPVYDLSVEGRLPPEYFPASSGELAQAVTCLYAMYEHGIEHFQDLSTLCIHIVGAGPSYEIIPTCVWEEITHCLPNVKTLKTVFVGPEACTVNTPPTDHLSMREIECCPTCISQGRKRIFGMYGFTYHDFVRSHHNIVPNNNSKNDNEADSLTPHLIVAFNTGMHEDDVESWRTSLEVILDTNVPALFTSYNRSEADQDYAILKGVGARLKYADGPKRNPFSEIKPEIDTTDIDNGVDAFFHKSMYCMAFKGRN